MRTTFLALLLSGLFTAVVQGEDEDRSMEISRNSYAAIAYSPATGKYAYACDLKSRKAAEKAALEKCKGDDAQIVCWINYGFCALALGDDKSCWGTGWKYGSGANNQKAAKQAMDECTKRTTGAHKVLMLSSDGQYIWDEKDHITIIDAHGNIYHGDELVTPPPKATASPGSKTSSPATKAKASSIFEALKDAKPD